VLTRLQQIPGVERVVEFHSDGTQTIDIPQVTSPGFPPPAAALVSCAQLTNSGLGRCPAGAAVAEVTAFIGQAPSGNLATFTWPAADVPVQQVDSLPLASLNVVTNGSQGAVEQARTVLENVYPTGIGTPYTLTEDSASGNAALNAYQQLADVVVLTSLAIAGCTLAVGVASGQAERKRPFSLLRLTGARLAMLRHVIVLESAVPLLAVAAVAIGIGFCASALYATMEMHLSLVSPEPAYYILTAVGIVLALAVILATFPLLRRITGPETARSE
jgi:predicted lysophospholipase L1 biosynthesis ABC-type transport system permease subunit